MKLVLIHGRAQGKRSSQLLRDEWTAALLKGYEAAGVTEPAGVDVRVPFYGAELDRLAASRQAEISDVVERGTGSDEIVSGLVAGMVDEIRKSAGITDTEVRNSIGADALEKGPENWEWVQAGIRLLSQRVPWLTEEVLANFLADVDTYINFPKKVDAIVRADIEGDEPTVVVSHSLGTVVAYNVLSAVGDPPKVPLFVTLGSPLGIQTIKKKVASPLGIPRWVSAWFNASDERDVVALFARLDEKSFIGGIENLTDLKNPHEHPHGIGGYLGDKRVAAKIAAALD